VLAPSTPPPPTTTSAVWLIAPPTCRACYLSSTLAAGECPRLARSTFGRSRSLRSVVARAAGVLQSSIIQAFTLPVWMMLLLPQTSRSVGRTGGGGTRHETLRFGNDHAPPDRRRARHRPARDPRGARPATVRDSQQNHALSKHSHGRNEAPPRRERSRGGSGPHRPVGPSSPGDQAAGPGPLAGG